VETKTVCGFNFLDRVKVELVFGNLENENTDVIINLSDAKLQNSSIQSNRLAEKAGESFKYECY
jgi:hypothetical protein